MPQATTEQWKYCILTNNQTNLYYTHYQQKGPYTVKKPYNPGLWSWCISTLAYGSLSWKEDMRERSALVRSARCSIECCIFCI